MSFVFPAFSQPCNHANHYISANKFSQSSLVLLASTQPPFWRNWVRQEMQYWYSYLQSWL